MAPNSARPNAAPTSRQCPTQPGDVRPLITHVIEKGLCAERQREFYHRCHRCLYRGKALDYLAPEELEQRNGTHFTDPVEPAPIQLGTEE